MTAIKTLEKRLEALEPGPPNRESVYDEYLSRCTVQELRDLDSIAKRFEKLPEDEQILTPGEREIVEAIERRLEIGQRTQLPPVEPVPLAIEAVEEDLPL